MKRRFFAALLAAVMLLSLVGCQQTPEATEPTPAPTEPEPTAQEVYSEACAELTAKADITLDVSQKLTTKVGGETIEQTSEQVLTYAGRGTETPVIRLEEVMDYVRLDEEEIEAGTTTRLYSEIYTGDTVYIELEEEAAFSGSLSAEESADRYIPVVLLDAALYETMTLEKSGNKTTIHFTAPTAAEAWALPEEAELLEASGAAVINATGTMEKMTYTVTYRYGSVENTWQVETKFRAQALAIAVPEDTERYTPIQSIDALWMRVNSGNLLADAKVVSINTAETVVCQAAGFIHKQSVETDMYDVAGDFMLRLESSVNFTDSKGSQTSTREETYKDGKGTVVVDNGIPSSISGIKESDLREALKTILIDYTTRPEFWKDVTLEDLGSVYLLNLAYTDELGESMQSALCQTYFGDMAFLNSHASKYETKEINGYLSIDKYTGMVVASGLYYEGVHTIQRQDCILSMQMDQKVELPSFGAYKAITDELQAEEEPEQKATPLFYHVTGENGQEMWLLGTIHVGDVRTGFLPQEIYDAFAASDALALEVDHESFEEKLKTDKSLQKKLSNAYYYSNGSKTEDHLDPELYEEALKYLKAVGGYNENMLYIKPSMWESEIQNFYLRQGHQLHSELGVEERLIKLAKEQEKPIREVESSLFQIQMLTGWSKKLQQLMLEDILEMDAQELWTETYELYELWCAGDEEALREEISNEVNLEEMTEEEKAEYEANRSLYEEYDKAMSYDRNKNMLKVAINYMKSGDVVFYAVGLAHLLDETNGLVDALRDAGYTVELVTYQ